MSRNRSIPRARDSRNRPGSTRKRLSQNFLTNPGVARMLTRSSGVGPTDLVVEIGPGDGMLTRQLLSAGAQVLAYEKDRHYADDKRICCLPLDFRDVVAPREPFSVVANIPFASTTDIVRWCLAARYLTSATLLVQREFARKQSGDYGRWTKLSVSHWPTATMELGARVGRHNFHPVPSVDSAVLRLTRRSQPLLSVREMPGYRYFVELGYSGLGGSLAASLTRAFPAKTVRMACAIAEIDTGLPVGFLPPDRWIALYRAMR
ncbi:ribosomal RNA small subunit methyltransferase A [Nocardia australiensis]|uniref:ribosomal RNA small subunit methyltransferase A n=1 Tax=Nocardia australiensis TaxID=2887191 RepID=UPI001D153421|nr:rRNA adenine N(6)-methyltransferase family protein [Nocardia australiensis]